MGIFKPSELSEECDKAARILKNFTDKAKIPPKVIQRAKGLAIFRGFRAGMYLAGTGGSGVVIARLSDGTWSPPSAFSVRSGGIGLVYGVDYYDCVCVLNTQEAVDAYAKPEMSLGGSVTLAAGPIGGNADVKNMKPVWTYTKSRGLYGGVTLDGTAIKEKPDTNAQFYGAKVTASQILNGDLGTGAASTNWITGAKKLIEMLKVAEGSKGDYGVIQEISHDVKADEERH